MVTKNYQNFSEDSGINLSFPDASINSGNDPFFFPHICAIYESSGQADSSGNEVFDGLYLGDCAYEVNVNGNTRLQGLRFQADSFLLLPCTDILFKINDLAIIETENGRMINATVKQFEIDSDLEIEGTTIWLKQGQDE